MITPTPKKKKLKKFFSSVFGIFIGSILAVIIVASLGVFIWGYSAGLNAFPDKMSVKACKIAVNETHNESYLRGYDYGFYIGFNNSEFKDNFYREHYIKNCVSSMCRENKDCVTDQIIKDTKTYCTLLMANKTIDEFFNELEVDFNKEDIENIIEEKEITPAPS